MKTYCCALFSVVLVLTLAACPVADLNGTGGGGGGQRDEVAADTGDELRGVGDVGPDLGFPEDDLSSDADDRPGADASSGFDVVEDAGGFEDLGTGQPDSSMSSDDPDVPFTVADATSGGDDSGGGFGGYDSGGGFGGYDYGGGFGGYDYGGFGGYDYGGFGGYDYGGGFGGYDYGGFGGYDYGGGFGGDFGFGGFDSGGGAFDSGGAFDAGPGEPGCTNTCRYADDGECDDGGPGSDYDLCTLGTDCADCGPRGGGGGGGLCTNTCSWAGDGECDDGGPGSDYSVCTLGTDCSDCGPR